MNNPNNMKVIMNAGPLKPPLTGVGYYHQSLLLALQESLAPEQLSLFLNDTIYSWEDYYQILLDEQSARNHKTPLSLKEMLLKKAKPIIKTLPFAYSARSWWLHQKIEKRLAPLSKAGVIYHETNYIPLPYEGKTIITVHDMAHIQNPDWHPKERVAYLNKKLPDAISEADAIITVSEFSRLAILARFPEVEDKLFVTLLGKDLECIPYSQENTCNTLAALNLTHQNYIFSACTLEPRKNLIRLVKAHQQLPEALRKEFPLVLSGAQGWKLKEWKSFIAPFVEKGELILLGYLPRQQLLHVYASAAVFVYPSLYEGFGLPIIEAMACGAPVLTSNIGAMQEVAGDAALTINPLDVDDISHGILTLLENKSLRDQYAKAGIFHSAQFSWANCAKDTLNIYHTI